VSKKLKIPYSVRRNPHSTVPHQGRSRTSFMLLR